MLRRQFGAVPEITTLAFAISVVFDEDAVREAQVSAESVSPMVAATALKTVSSVVDLSVTLEIVGASLTALTVRTNVSVAVSRVSVTVRVIVEVPD